MESGEKIALIEIGIRLMLLRDKSPSADRRRQYFQMLDDIAMTLVNNCGFNYCDVINQMDAGRRKMSWASEDKP